MEKDDATIVKTAMLDPRHVRTGNTRHYRGGKLTPPPTRLIIVRFADGYNLIHLDAENHELTDTFHETVDHAMKQAAFEFSVESHDWEDLNEPYE